MSSANLGYTDFGYACDENGCVLVVQQDSNHKTGEGRGWQQGALRLCCLCAAVPQHSMQ